MHQMMEVNDIPCILIPLLESKPWIRKNAKGEREVYEDQRWQVKKDTQTITKVEAQIWLTIYSMFMCQDTQRKYEVTTFRKSNLLRLRKFMNEVLLDQLPVLTEMLRALEELSMMQESTIASSNPFHVQVLPEIRDGIVNGKDWKDIAKYQVEQYFSMTDHEAREEMMGLMNLYNSDMLDDFLEQPRCGQCGKEAKNRCSKCKHEWYCGRECQMKAWKGHKKLCALLGQSITDDKRQKDQEKKQQKQQQKEREEKVLVQEIKQKEQPDVVSDVVREQPKVETETDSRKVQSKLETDQENTKSELKEQDLNQKSEVVSKTTPNETKISSENVAETQSKTTTPIENDGSDGEGEIDFDECD